ncbi:peptidoglycan editing factor PgeF [Paraburkholderia gardini]|uniref:Purine nucleoside phosphorylase n=1 Tax=Paraburkholderia gardini TaxID=2823469 RepID=A0ABN7QDS6_9BURK|nr:peptidoglycan editing factor PgeF [Paraburkholderia gardini]CAG4887898.1 Polyphenol oxidase [Paraburkholderia gardini]CAG4891108.1 Polyphenol oxidase [Paraburkholderia gardini]
MTSAPELTFADVLQPVWRVSPRVHSLVTTRNGGVSRPPFGRWTDGVEQPGGLNLGRRAGDDPEAVELNRARLLALTGTPAAWLEQIHGAEVVNAADVLAGARQGAAPVRADASVTDRPGTMCIVMIADCMPVLLCDANGRAVGAAHAGWRGLAAGIVEKTAARVAQLAGTGLEGLHAYLGPSIGPTAFEVGADVRDAFMNGVDGAQRDATSKAFVPRAEWPGKYLADLPALARIRLNQIGVTQITGADACTVTGRSRFYSYRRDAETGRMAAMIWLAD